MRLVSDRIADFGFIAVHKWEVTFCIHTRFITLEVLMVNLTDTTEL